MDAPASPARDGARPLALVVEGDAIQRIETADCVAEAGFEVIEAWNGPTALRQIERHPELRLAVIDADLPDPDGRFALTHAIAALRPGLTLMAVSAGVYMVRVSTVNGGVTTDLIKPAANLN